MTRRASWTRLTQSGRPEENEVLTTEKKSDIEYKSKELKKLEEYVVETKDDKKSLVDEVDAIGEQVEKIDKMCVAKVEPYEETKRRREAELAGLKEALVILQGRYSASYEAEESGSTISSYGEAQGSTVSYSSSSSSSDSSSSSSSYSSEAQGGTTSDYGVASGGAVSTYGGAS